MRAGLKQTMALATLSAVLASGCSSPSHPATTSITVFASSAMIKSLTAIGKQFEAENPGTSVEFIFASSSDLSAELADGNDADVFVSGDYDNMGQILTAGAGQLPARQAAVAAGIGWDVPAITINKMCLSGLNAIALADQLIRAGEFDVVVAGGQESMTKAPHLLMDSRAGYKYGDVTVLDHMITPMPA